jgi:hypothetical protein
VGGTNQQKMKLKMGTWWTCVLTLLLRHLFPPRGAVVAASSISIAEEIVARRHIARNSYYNPDEEEGEHPGCGANDETATFLRPRDEAGAGAPCQKAGVVVRRDMGSLGVSSFQQVVGAIMADAIGPLWLYYDEWPEAAKLLRESATHDDFRAHALIEEGEKNRHRMLTLRPQLQDELAMQPWNMTDDVASHWARKLRRSVCGPNEDGFPNDVAVIRVYGNFQHVAYFRRYRSFIRHCVLKSATEFESMYEPQFAEKAEVWPRPKGFIHPSLLLEAKDSKKAVDGKEPPPDLLVYLRLGDKSASGDTHLTFKSGYYDAVLAARRAQHETCWIVTNSPRDHRATRLASAHDCRVQASGHYSDWALMYLTRGTVSNECTLLSHPFVIFFG